MILDHFQKRNASKNIILYICYVNRLFTLTNLMKNFESRLIFILIEIILMEKQMVDVNRGKWIRIVKNLQINKKV